MINEDTATGTGKIELGAAMSPGNVVDIESKRKERDALNNDVEAFLKSGGKVKHI